MPIFLSTLCQRLFNTSVNTFPKLLSARALFTTRQLCFSCYGFPSPGWDLHTYKTSRPGQGAIDKQPNNWTHTHRYHPTSTREGGGWIDEAHLPPGLFQHQLLLQLSLLCFLSRCCYSSQLPLLPPEELCHMTGRNDGSLVSNGN